MRGLHSFLMFWLVLFVFFAYSLMGEDNVKRILQVESHTSIDPWTLNSANGLRDALSHAGIEVNYEIFQFGVGFQAGMLPQEADIEALQTKLDRQHYDLVVAYNNNAADLFLNGRLKLKPGTPLLLDTYSGILAAELQRKLNMTAVLSPFHPYENIQLGLTLLPEPEKIVLVIDASAEGQQQRQLLANIRKDLAGKLVVISGTDDSTREFLEKIAALPPKTLLIYHSWGSAKDNLPGDSYVMLRRIRKIFPGLILGRYDTFIPLGSNGGVGAVGREQGKLTGALGIRILNGENPSTIPYQKAPTHVMLDYQAIRDFNIPMNRIPAGTEILNMPPDFLTRFRVELAVGASLIFLLLSGYILVLLRRRHEQKKATALFRNLPLRVFIFDRKERVLFSHVPDPAGGMVNESITRLEQLSHPEAREQIRAALRQAFDSGEKVLLDFKVENQYRHAEFLRLPDRNPFRTEVVMCISSNVTELQEAHREIGNIAERLRLTLRSIGDGVITTDCAGNVMLLNPEAVKMTGYPLDEARGKKIEEVFDIVSYLTGDPVESPLRKALNCGKTVELANHTDLIAKDGTRRHIADCASPIRDENGTIIGGVLVFRDVTDDYEKRDRLRINDAILKIVQNIADIGYFRCTSDKRTLLAISERYWPRNNGEPVHPSEWVASEDLNEFMAAWQKLLTDQTSSIVVSYSAGSPKRYFELRATKSINQISGRREYFGVIQDITLSRRKEQETRSSLQLLQNIMDNLPGSIFLKDADNDFRYVMCNRQFGEMSGLDSGEIPGRNDFEIFTSDSSAARQFLENDRKIIRINEKMDIREEFNADNGRRLILKTIKTPMEKIDGGKLLLGISIDITREYQLEQQQKQTIEALDYATRCERIINQSLSMITLEPELETAVDEMLRIIGENSDADRAYIFLYSAADCRYAIHKYEWVRDGVEPQKEKYQQIDMETCPVLKQTLGEKREILIQDTAKPRTGVNKELVQLLPPDIRSMLITGIWQNDRQLGFVGLDYVRKTHEFGSNSVYMVKSIANLFLLARERAQQLERIAETTLLQKQIVDNIAVPIAIIDNEFQFLAANPSLLQQLGKPWEEVQPRKCYETLCRQPEPPSWCCLAREQEALTAHSSEVEWFGRKFIVNTQPIYDRNHKIRYALKSMVDITGLHRQKEELQEAMEQARAADRAKSYFLATMSHELRTPLNAVIGFSELLQNDDVSEEEQAEYLRSINCAGAALLNLINDVLDLSKLEAEQLNITPVRTDFSRLLRDMVALFQLKAKEKNILLELEPVNIPGPLYIDQLRIRQILLNLIGNAIKFTHQGGVTVRAKFLPENSKGSGELRIRVSDTGIGIAKEQAAKVFDPFFQVGATRGTRAYEGSGLGLAISMRLVQRMGGTIELDSNPAEGSTFTVKLPNVRYEQAVENTAVSSGAGAATVAVQEGLRVLLVDDVAMNLKVLQAMLRRLNVESVCADSGEQALAVLRKDDKFQIILTDLWMPGMNGEQLADQIRTIPAMQKIKIVAVTADTEARSSFDQAKFDDILQKPVTLESLSKIFRRLSMFFAAREQENHQ